MSKVAFSLIPRQTSVEKTVREEFQTKWTDDPAVFRNQKLQSSTGPSLSASGHIVGVNVTDMKCLDMMTQQGAAMPSQLAAHTGLSSGATTAMIDRLEKAGLVERRSHPKDRRGTMLVLTQEAKRRLPSLFGSLGTAMEALVSSYPPKDRKRTVKTVWLS